MHLVGIHTGERVQVYTMCRVPPSLTSALPPKAIFRYVGIYVSMLTDDAAKKRLFVCRIAAIFMLGLICVTRVSRCAAWN